jgi:hypothetical protein
MDKNMINIDDLFKQRLAGGEENERPGAWLQMRELLDKNMPVDKVPGTTFNWRRMFGYMAALLALTAVSVGSYQAISGYKADKANRQLATAAVYNAPATGNTNRVIVNNAPKTIAATTVTSTNSTGKTVSSDRPAVSKTNAKASTLTTHTATGKPSIAGTTNTVKTTISGTTEIPKSNTNTDIAATKTTNEQTIKSYNSNTANKLNNNNLNSISESKTSNKNTPANTSSNSLGSDNNSVTITTGKTERNTTAKTQQPVKTEQSVTATDLNSASFAANASNASGKKASATSGALATANEPIAYTTKKTTISKIELRHTYKRGGGGLFKVDTINMDKFEVERRMPIFASNNNNNTAENQEIVPSSTASSASTDNRIKEEWKPLANYRTGSKKISNWTPERFEEMVKNAKFDFSQTTFHGGVIAGINSSLASNATKGFQFGLTGQLSLNEKWGIFSEIKYIQKFNGSERFNGKFNDRFEQEVNSGQGTLVQWRNVEYAYKFSYLNMLEMPVAVRYSMNRFNVFSGVNMNYNFGVNVERVDRTTESGKMPANLSTFDQNNLGPKVNPADFGARYSVGYMFGAGYQLSPAFQLDARIAHPLWDNANTTNSRAVSRELYNLPTLQINAGYRFNSNRRLR